MLALRVAWTAVLSALALAAQEAPMAPIDPAIELARVVDLPDPASREKAANELARLDVGLGDWLAAMQVFAPGQIATPGEGRETVPCWNGAELESTEIDWLVPRSVAVGQPVPLMVVTHGTGGSGRGLCAVWQDAAQVLGMIVIAPSESGPNDGYGYSERERQITLASIRWARRRWDIDEDRVFLSGISRGGHLSWDVALRYPDRFGAIVPMIGGPRINPSDGQNNLRYLENVANLSIRDLQGARDDAALVFNLRLAFERLRGMNAPDAVLVEFPEHGHSYDPTAVDWPEFLGSAQRDPRPDRVVRLAAHRDEGRAFWVEVLATDSRAVQETFRPRAKAAEWDALDDAGRRRFLADAADQRTARIEARLESPGSIRVETRHVRRFRLLLVPEMLDADGRLQVSFGAKKRKLQPKPDSSVLLREFVERFDRRFLPISEVDLRP